MQMDMFAGATDPRLRVLSTNMPGVDITVVRTTDILQPATGVMSGHTDYCVNPYIGCAFGCSYCHAAEFVQDDERRSKWGQWVKARANASQTIIIKHPPGELENKHIFFGSVTDPYQPLEQRLHITRRILEVLLKRPEYFRIHIQTRSSHVADDALLFECIAASGKHMSIGVSIPTDDEMVRQHLEPKAPSIPSRMRALSKLSRQAPSVSTTAAVGPAMPMKDPKHFTLRLAKTGVKRIVGDTINTKIPRRDGPPRAATRETAWPLLAEVLGLSPKTNRGEIIAAYHDRVGRDLDCLLEEVNRLGLSQATRPRRGLIYVK